MHSIGRRSCGTFGSDGWKGGLAELSEFGTKTNEIPSGRTLYLFRISLDAITIIDNYTVSEVFDLKDGKIVNRITLSKDIHRQPFTDIRIINATEGFLKYAIMTNIEINVYENHKIVETIKNPGNMTYVFFDYDKQKKVVVVGSVNDGATEVRVYPADNSQEPFVFAFDPLNDYLLRTWQYVLVVKPPTKTQRFMIVAHKVLGREMLYNDIVKEIGGEFQVLLFNSHNRLRISLFHLT